MDEKQVRARVRALLESQPLAVLATVMDGQPHCDLVAFANTSDLRYVLFATARASRKYESLIQHSEISMLVDSRVNAPSDFQDAEAVTLDGTAREVGEEKAKYLGLYVEKHRTLKDFALDPSTALICLDVARLKYVTHFQEVYVLSS